jgi:hypothetical protein
VKGNRTPLLPEAARWWRTIWRSRPAAAWDREADLGTLTRYILMFDSWLRLDGLYAAAPIVKGSKGGLVENPAGVAARRLDAALKAFEDRYGLQPRARIALGLAMSEGLATLEDLMGAPGEQDYDEFALPDGLEDMVIEGEAVER